MNWNTVLGVIAYRANRDPDWLFTRFLAQGEVTATYTYREAWAWFERWATLLIERGLRRGQVAVLALPNTDDFLGAYYGTLLAGGIPAPVAPFRRIEADDPYLGIVAGRLAFADARVLVVPESQTGLAQLPALTAMDGLAVVSRQELPPEGKPLAPPGDENALGLLQFTSGTSGKAKAVMLSNRAMLAQTHGLATVLRLTDRSLDSAVSWLPLYHDMGIIGFLLTPSIPGGTVTIMATEDFIRRPGLWIKALSDYGATITGGPPSGYLLCVRRMKQAEVEQHDLSRLRIALVGAEMITADSLRQFVEKFEPAGFRATSLLPTYGLAENGLAVTMPPLDQPPLWDALEARGMHGEGLAEAPGSNGQAPRSFVSVGVPLPEMEVAIVNPAGERLAEREAGEIIVRSPSLMDGYLHQPEATREALRDGWLWTGDLGYLAGGNLYMIGRKKEVLIIGGRNYFPEELEEAAAVPGVRADRVVAISYEDAERATEVAVVLAETNLTEHAERDALRLRIRKAVVGAGFPLSRVVLLPLKTIRSTMNGKLMRSECKDRFLAGEFADDD